MLRLQDGTKVIQGGTLVAGTGITLGEDADGLPTISATGYGGTNPSPFDIVSALPGQSRMLRLLDKPTATKYNWILAAQHNVDNGWELTPSTAVGGTTFSVPTLKGDLTSLTAQVAATIDLLSTSGGATLDTFVARSGSASANESVLRVRTISHATASVRRVEIESLQHDLSTGAELWIQKIGRGAALFGGGAQIGGGVWPTASIGFSTDRAGVVSSSENGVLLVHNNAGGVGADRGGEIYLGARGTNATENMAFVSLRGVRESGTSGTLSTKFIINTMNAAGTAAAAATFFSDKTSTFAGSATFDTGGDVSTSLFVGAGGGGPSGTRSIGVVLNAPSSGSFPGQASIGYKRNGTSLWDVGLDIGTTGAKGANTDYYWWNPSNGYVAALTQAGLFRALSYIDSANVTDGAVRIYNGTTHRGGIGTRRWATGTAGHETDMALFAVATMYIYTNNSATSPVKIDTSHQVTAVDFILG